MISRWALCVCAAALAAGGCCCPDMCGSGCGPCGGGSRGSLFCRPYEQRMAESNSAACGTCNTPVGCGHGGVRGWLRNQSTCCKGCGDMYWGEWISDPPDCCDPCDSCGGFSGCGGTCCKPDILARLVRAFHGYRYCPGDCGSGCGLASLGCSLCDGAGCDSCGAGGGPLLERGYRDGRGGSVLDENWDPPPSPKPTPGKPIHKADTPHSIKVGSSRLPGGAPAARQSSYEAWR